MIAVIGGGAWGTALANIMAEQEDVLLWVREEDVADAVNRARENPLFLPGVSLSPRIRATTGLDDLAATDLWLCVPPAQFLGPILERAPVAARPTIILCSKGIERGTHRLMTEVAAAAAPRCDLAVLSGPSFAAEAARGLPTAVTLAAPTLDRATLLAERLARPHFRPYASDDRIGCEIGGAVKNVLAIACGAVIGAGLGENARAATLARGFAEMARFGVARGGRLATLSGLSGLGDLVLTCGSAQSRNMALGIALGEGKTIAAALEGKRSIAEGAATAPVLVEAAEKIGIDMPITAAVADLLGGRFAVDAIIERLLRRPLRVETD